MRESTTISLPRNVALSDKLTVIELGLYVRARGILASGRKGFRPSDLKESEDVAKAAVDRLVALGLIAHTGGGYYSLTKKSIASFDRLPEKGLVQQLTAAAGKRQPSSKDGRYEQLRDQLNEIATNTFGYKPPSVTYSTNPVNKTCYRKIFTLIDEVGSTIQEFVWFVFQHDWAWTKTSVPFPPTFSHDQFLAQFTWYAENKVELKEAGSVLSSYDSAFGTETKHSLENLQLALQLQNKLDADRANHSQFFIYVRTLNWNSFGGFPPLSFLLSKIVDQYRNTRRRSGDRTAIPKVTSTYLGRILDRLRQIPKKLTHDEFEDHNWQVAEAILEPLYASSNGSPSNLSMLISRATTEKNLSTFGAYLITFTGQLTPLAVYAITYASNHLEEDLSPDGYGDWQEIVRERASEHVNLAIMEEKL